ncbi:hypothetical protein PWT90_02296 [Aphanocladium album]|nr:hypothetical protein PWT90_02296 [Aphanocladium album]
MLSWLKSPFKLATVPSVLLVVGNFGSSLHIIHPVPENSINERFSSTISSSATTFRCGDITEEAREQIGIIALHAGHGETVSSFLDDVEARILKLRDDSSSSSPAHPQTASFAVTQLVQHVLNPAAMASSKMCMSFIPNMIWYIASGAVRLFRNSIKARPSCLHILLTSVAFQIPNHIKPAITVFFSPHSDVEGRFIRDP